VEDYAAPHHPNPPPREEERLGGYDTKNFTTIYKIWHFYFDSHQSFSSVFLAGKGDL